MNPFAWKHAHLVIWAVVALAGAALGTVMGFATTPFSRGQGANTGAMLVAWLHYPAAWWPWAVAGAVTAALAYYAADLFTGAR